MKAEEGMEQGAAGGREQVKQEPKVNLPFDAGNVVPGWQEDQNLWNIPTLVKNPEKKSTWFSSTRTKTQNQLKTYSN